MKKLIISFLSFFLIFNVQASQSAVEDFARKAFAAIKNNDFALFQSLYLNSFEMGALFNTGLIHIHDSTTKKDEVLNFYRSNKYPEIIKEYFMEFLPGSMDGVIFNSIEIDHIEKNIPIQAFYFSPKEDMARDIEAPRKGIDFYSITVYYYQNGVKLSTGFNALMLPANLTPSSPERLVFYP